MADKKPDGGVTETNSAGGQYHVTFGGDQTTVTFGGGWYDAGRGPTVYIPGGVSVTGDNIDKTQTSTAFTGKPITKIDVDSLDKAIDNLNQWAQYIKTLEQQGMHDIKAMMDGPQPDADVMKNSGTNGQTGGPLGGFPGAAQLAHRHSTLWQSYQQGLKTVAANLYDAADALKKVKQKYGDVEHANVMSAAQMETDFTDAKSVPHNL